MSTGDGYRLGVVEGFFGRPWSWQARRDYARFLASIGCNTYVYAPKSDVWLRKQWQSSFPVAHHDALRQLASHYRLHKIEFGIGLSPFELYRDFSVHGRELLRLKLDEIDAIGPDTVCILFDDMMGDLRGLARAQLDIIDFVLEHSQARRFAVCPTYYSADPLLARHFGPQPERYLEDLGHGLDPEVDVFWTGPKVISDCYPREHLEETAIRLRRKPLLWDNYPVNDAKRLVPFLNLLPFSKRGAELSELCAGHLANPMNQPYLSQLPLHTLPALYTNASDVSARFAAACTALCPPALAAALQEDVELLQHSGLEQLDAATHARLSNRYGAFNHPMASEICAWLRGEYAFEPSCLT
jgi:hyaluronoglucosaminidase